MAEPHAKIIKRNGSDFEVAEKIGAKAYQVRDWRLRNSIPAEQWKPFADHEMASLDELAEAATEWASLSTEQKKRVRRELQEGFAA
jgi:hypothetical protein